MKRLGIALVITATLGLILVAAPSAGAAPYPPAPPPTVGGDPTPTPGSITDLSGSNWCPGSTVQIFLDGDFIGNATVDSSGQFLFGWHVPPNISPGPHTLTFKGLDSTCDNLVTVSMGITIAGEGAAGGNLPFTGSNISVGVLLLAALMIIGAASLVAGRRRKATAAGE